MKLLPTPIDGLKLIQLDVFGDTRGFFVERFHEGKFRELGLPTLFLQDNHSRSAPGVLRGLHYQSAPAQGKLVGCTRGRIWDVAVDIRPGSATFGGHFGVEITGENGLLLFVPGGFAHGFCVLGDEPADVLYKCTATYNAKTDGGLHWNDPELAVAWPLSAMNMPQGAPLVSDKDAKQPSFSAYKANPPEWQL